MSNDLPNHICQQCGKCCSSDFLREVDTVDIGRWIFEQRWDILEKILPVIEEMVIKGKTIRTMIWNVWFDIRKYNIGSCPGDYYHNRCPFLGKKKGKYICKINDTKPLTCKGYPYKIHKMCLREKEEHKRL